MSRARASRVAGDITLLARPGTESSSLDIALCKVAGKLTGKVQRAG
ncbi:MAG: hypothetical protein M0Z82_11560 [Actinomycetota bacterium]|nr:hypothetical protein [Actinomycetota bacterium]